MQRIQTNIVIKTLDRQLKRLQASKKGGTIAYSPGELEHVIKTFEQIKSDYKAYKVVGKPLWQSEASFLNEIKHSPSLFNPESGELNETQI